MSSLFWTIKTPKGELSISKCCYQTIPCKHILKLDGKTIDLYAQGNKIWKMIKHRCDKRTNSDKHFKFYNGDIRNFCGQTYNEIKAERKKMQIRFDKCNVVKKMLPMPIADEILPHIE